MTEPAVPGKRETMIESLWRDARREAEEIILRSRESADKILKESSRHNDHLLAESLEKTRAEVSPDLARILNRARMEARASVLAKQNGILAEVFDQALSMIADRRLDPGEARRAFPLLLEEALEGFLPGKEAHIHIHPEDRKACAALLKERGITARISEDTSIAGGVRVTTEKEIESVDNTLQSRLRSLRESPSLALYRLLFPADTGDTGERGP